MKSALKIYHFAISKDFLTRWSSYEKCKCWILIHEVLLTWSTNCCLTFHLLMRNIQHVYNFSTQFGNEHIPQQLGLPAKRKNKKRKTEKKLTLVIFLLYGSMSLFADVYCWYINECGWFHFRTGDWWITCGKQWCLPVAVIPEKKK